MATAQNVTTDVDRGQVDIDSLTVHDPKLASFLDESQEAPEDALEQVLRVGASTLTLADTTREVEFVQREFDALREKFEDDLDEVQDDLDQTFGDDGTMAAELDRHLGDDGTVRAHLDDAFGEEGLFARRLEAELGEEGNTIQQALDPDIEGTPTNRLRQTLREEIREIGEKLEREAGREEERSRSHQSGYDFEDILEELLIDVAYNTADTVERTSETEGELPGRDVGDFVFTTGEMNHRIVIEAKSRQYSRPDIENEMEEAIENRDADYGIFVSEYESDVPDTVGYFQDCENYVCIALSADEDDTIDDGFLHIALRWARARVVQESLDSSEGLDAEELQARIEGVRDSIGRVKTAKRKCTSMQNTAGDIKTLLDELRDDVKTDLDAVTLELQKAN